MKNYLDSSGSSSSEQIIIRSNATIVGELLESKTFYEVPKFQRSYSWRKAYEIEEFWEDFMTAFDNSEPYFMGPMVFTPGEKGKLRILDGQQRCATFMLLIAALRESVIESDIIPPDVRGKRENALNDLLFQRQTVSMETHPKLVLGRDDKEFFNSLVLDGTIERPECPSHKLIRAAYQYFKQEIGNRISEGDAFVQRVLTTLLENMVVIKIEVNTVANAHALFEGLNDRGRALSVADLVKNYLFLVSKDTDLDSNVESWLGVIDQVGQEKITQFLRYYWMSNYSPVKTQRLYKVIRDEINTPKSVNSFIRKLSKESEVFANLEDPTYEFWQDLELVDMVRELKILGLDQVKVLILALYETEFSHPSKFKPILRKLINFSFRYSTVAEQDPKVLEKKYSSLAKGLRNRSFDSKYVIDALRDLSPKSEVFVPKFSVMKVKARGVPKYILLKIVDYCLKQERTEELQPDQDEINLEHIIPKKPYHWEDFFQKHKIEGQQKKEELIYSLGNMALILGKWNTEMSNKKFEEKVPTYRKSKLPFTKDLGNLTSFSPSEINRRQSEMAEIADKVWVV